MISTYRKNDRLHFKLDMKDNSYVFAVTKYGHLETLYMGKKTEDTDFSLSQKKNNAGFGSSVLYEEGEENYCLDDLMLEYSGIGKGDFRNSPVEIRMPNGGYTCDFCYISHEIEDGAPRMADLPTAYSTTGEEVQTLQIITKDTATDVFLRHSYIVFPKANVICRSVAVKNESGKTIEIRKIMSAMLDIDQTDFKLISFDGGWIKEAHRNESEISQGIHIISSTTGSSSNRHNPGVILQQKDATEDDGLCIGLNLIYSGNHQTAVEKSPNGTLRIENGINPHCFSWELGENEQFKTPQSVITFSMGGMNGISKNFHHFVKNNIVRGEHKDAERPVLINNWEAYMFDFNQRKILSLAKSAKKLGVEMFVLDDGWFGKRNSDRAGLGDYSYNKKKLPKGLSPLVEKINKMGMKFGLWFEPEMTNKDSDLYRAHPDWVVADVGRAPAFGRNQLVLDLANESVRDYIVENVNKILQENNIEYVKWDMNRHISDMYSPKVQNQGEFFHRHTLGLYDILSRITEKNPKVLFESCSSGGNRFDLGMLCFTPQIWVSDNTDPIERLDIQDGLSCLYPQSTFGAHVSMTPHAQTLRETPLSTRFNVSAFGLLGYELELKHLSREEKKEIKEQISFYKKHRRTLQFGEFSRRIYQGKKVWQVSGEDCIIVGNFQQKISSAPPSDVLKIKGIKGDVNYNIYSKPQRIPIKRFGGLIKHALPINLNPNGCILRWINKIYSLRDAVEKHTASGAQISSGVRLNQQFNGTFYNDTIRLLGDFGSTLYVVEEQK